MTRIPLKTHPDIPVIKLSHDDVERLIAAIHRTRDAILKGMLLYCAALVVVLAVFIAVTFVTLKNHERQFTAIWDVVSGASAGAAGPDDQEHGP